MKIITKKEGFINIISSKHTVAIPPGMSIKEKMEDSGMTQKEFAIRMGLSQKHISRLINGKVELTQEVALRLEQVLGPPASYWNKFEALYRETIIRIEREREMEEDENLLPKIPYAKLAKLKWVPKTTEPLEKVSNLRSFFEVAKLTYLKNIENDVIVFPYIANNNSWAIDAFAQKLRRESRKEKVTELNQSKFRKAIIKIKDLNFNEFGFSEKLKDILSASGVVLILLPQIEGTTFKGLSYKDNRRLLVGLTNPLTEDIDFYISMFQDIYNKLYGVETQEKKTDTVSKYLA